MATLKLNSPKVLHLSPNNSVNIRFTSLMSSFDKFNACVHKVLLRDWINIRLWFMFLHQSTTKRLFVFSFVVGSSELIHAWGVTPILPLPNANCVIPIVNMMLSMESLALLVASRLTLFTSKSTYLVKFLCFTFPKGLQLCKALISTSFLCRVQL